MLIAFDKLTTCLRNWKAKGETARQLANLLPRDSRGRRKTVGYRKDGSYIPPPSKGQYYLRLLTGAVIVVALSVILLLVSWLVPWRLLSWAVLSVAAAILIEMVFELMEGYQRFLDRYMTREEYDEYRLKVQAFRTGACEQRVQPESECGGSKSSAE